MILQGLSAETLARLVALARHGEDYSGLLAGPAQKSGELEADPRAEVTHPPAFKLAAE